MKKLLVKIAAAIGLSAVSVVAMAASMDCCADIECCLRMLANCCG
jgi:hypothetical protein